MARSTSTRTSVPAQRRRPERESIPLGSLTQRDNRSQATCEACGSSRVTELSMCLTDGTPVRFASCRACEHRVWQHEGGDLSVDGVLDRTRTPA